MISLRFQLCWVVGLDPWPLFKLFNSQWFFLDFNFAASLVLLIRDAGLIFLNLHYYFSILFTTRIFICVGACVYVCVWMAYKSLALCCDSRHHSKSTVQSDHFTVHQRVFNNGLNEVGILIGISKTGRERDSTGKEFANFLRQRG